MKRLAITLAASAVILAGAAMTMLGQAPAADAQLQAMKDELERTRKMTLSGLEAPYFIQYLIDESHNLSLSATLGGLLSKRHDNFRQPEIRIRVGDYKFDNGNFAGGFGLGSRYDLERFPLDDSYPVLRRYLWLESDSAYKAAVEALSRKRAAIRNLNQNDVIADFARAEPVKRLRPFNALRVDEEGWTNRVRSLSAIFSQYPDVKNSSIEFESAVGGYTIVNSEGTEVREPEDVSFVRARALGQAPDGMTTRDAVTFHALDSNRLPGDAELTRGIKTLAENVTALSKAPKGEDYSGPILFEGMAGAQIVGEVLGHNLALTRRPVGDGGRGGGGQASELEGRIGARVLPESFDVVDDPTQKEYRGRALFGQYEVDREGVLAQPLRVVEKGVLKRYLLTRQPVRGFEGSNGHARIPGNFGASAATISNLFVSSTETQPVADLKKKLIELCQARSKPYGIIIRKMDFPSSASIDEARRLITAQQGMKPVSMPILVYKVFADGREELVRGLRFRGLNVRSLKDIVAAGNDTNVFEFLDSTAPFALIGGSGYTSESVVIAPSILIDDLELHPAEDEQPKLPIVPAPDVTK